MVDVIVVGDTKIYDGGDFHITFLKERGVLTYKQLYKEIRNGRSAYKQFYEAYRKCDADRELTFDIIINYEGDKIILKKYIIVDFTEDDETFSVSLINMKENHTEI